MTEKEFNDELVRLGFKSTIKTFGLLRHWEHVSGSHRIILEAHYIDADKRGNYLKRIRKSLGLK